MSLATRCINCGTVFRIVQDQLLVSEGWVRCGRCREVFNAIENMFDLRKSGAAAASPPSPSTTETPSTQGTHSPQHEATESGAVSRPSPDEAPTTGDDVVRTSLWPSSDAPSMYPGKRSRGTAALRGDEDFESSALTLDVPSAGPLPSENQVDELLTSNSRDTTFAAYEDMPEFIERAQADSWWRRPKVRLALRVATVLLCAALLLQVAMHGRDTLVARWPATESAFQTLCVPLGCRIDAPRDLDALKLESTSFSDAGSSGVYRLVVVLRNQRDVLVRMPSLDVRLFDARGDTLARRVVMAQELGARESAIAAASEVTLQGTLRVAKAGVSGYDVTAFYP